MPSPSEIAKGLTEAQRPARDMALPISHRDAAARAIYEKRPFYLAESTTPMERSLSISRKFEWDAAPAFYQQECYELGDAVLAALANRDIGEQIAESANCSAHLAGAGKLIDEERP